MQLLERNALAVLILSLAGACGGAPAANHATGAPSAKAAADPGPERLEICLRNGIGILGYTYEQALQSRARFESEPCVARLTEADVVEYRVGDPPSGQVDLVLTAGASALVKADPDSGEDVCMEGPFVVSFEGRELFMGQCYLRMGAAALQFPVMHIEEEAGRVVLFIRDQQGGAGGEESKRRMDPPELRQLFAELGRLEKR